jgi:hypothetical protein
VKGRPRSRANDLAAHRGTGLASGKHVPGFTGR